jgi:hypothetical protein
LKKPIMRVRYTIQCDERDGSVRAFEDTLSFGEGFRQLDIPASIGAGRLTALEIDPEFHVNFQFCQL